MGGQVDNLTMWSECNVAATAHSVTAWLKASKRPPENKRGKADSKNETRNK
jgi:hypothetical protein